MMKNIDLGLREDLSLSFNSDNEISCIDKKSINNTNCIDTNFLKRFATPFHTEILSIFNEDLCITRYDGDEVYSLFQIESELSYIIVGKYSELKVKPIRSLQEWQTIEASSTPVKPRGSGTGSHVSELDITGSPLGCHFKNGKQPDLELSFQDCFDSTKKKKNEPKTYQAFSVDVARSILFQLKLTLKSLKDENVFLPPIWIACDGKDVKKTVFVGLVLNDKGLSTCSMTSFGPHCGEENLPTLDRINSHFSLGSSLPRVKTRVEAMYEVLSGKGMNSSSVDLRCRWAQPLTTLCSPGPDTFTTISLHLEANEEKSQTRFLFCEFDVLRNYIDALSDTNLKLYHTKRDKNVAHMLQQYFQNFRDKVLDQKNKVSNEKDSVANLDKMVKCKFIEMRPNLDFTDEIWNILKGSENLAELTEGLKTVFENISRGSIRPKIYSRNDTQFAVICRDLMRGQGQIPSLETWKPIEMLIEIGLEKIKKDYMSVFQACDLVYGEQLSSYTNWSSKSVSYSECLSKLEKMMIILKAIVILRCNLNLDNSVLSHYTSKTLLDLQSKTELPKDFEFQVEIGLVQNIVDHFVPTSWIYSTWSESEDTPQCTKWMKFAINKDEPFFNMEANLDTQLSSPFVDEESHSGGGQKFFSLSIIRSGDIL